MHKLQQTTFGLIVALCLSHIPLQATDQIKQTFFLACTFNGTQKFKELLKNDKININAQNKDGNTPLHIFCKEKHEDQEEQEEQVKLLIENEAKVHIKNKAGQTPYDVASDEQIRNLLKKAQEKLNKSKKDNTNSPNNTTPPIINKIEIIDDNQHLFDQTSNTPPPNEILENKKTSNKTNVHNHNEPPKSSSKIDSTNLRLHETCEEAHLDTAKPLIENEANVHIKNKNEQTPRNLTSKENIKNFLDKEMKKTTSTNTLSINENDSPENFSKIDSPIHKPITQPISPSNLDLDLPLPNPKTNTPHDNTTSSGSSGKIIAGTIAILGIVVISIFFKNKKKHSQRDKAKEHV